MLTVESKVCLSESIVSSNSPTLSWVFFSNESLFAGSVFAGLNCNLFKFSTLSGGVSRDWTGVPRKLYQPGSRGSRCVCVRTAGAPWGQPDSAEHSDRGDLDNPQLEEYEGCDPLAPQCVLKV